MSHEDPKAHIKNSGLEPGWIPLPSYSFGMPLPDSEEAFKEFTKLMFRVIAIGVAKTPPKPSEDYQLALLCRSYEEEHYTYFAAFAPSPQLVAFVRAHLPPNMDAKTLSAVIESSETEVRHAYAFLPDTLLPIAVFHYPAKHQVLVSNRNLYETPDEFLNPHSCRTTSGFLIFLGALSFVMAKSKPNSPKTFIAEKIDDPMSCGLTEWCRWQQHLLDSGSWETNRIFINENDPERYVYNYTPAHSSSVIAPGTERFRDRT
jgi:hypothetical protein